VALLDIEPEELDPAAGLVFVGGHDDLDAVRVATFRAASGREYAFVRHANSLVPGTEILTTASLVEAPSIVEDVRAMLAILRLGRVRQHLARAGDRGGGRSRQSWSATASASEVAQTQRIHG
jgi:hypothetical protein